MNFLGNVSYRSFWPGAYIRDHYRFMPSQWETVLLCNDVSHWLGASQESALFPHFLMPLTLRHLGLFSSRKYFRLTVLADFSANWLRNVIASRTSSQICNEPSPVRLADKHYSDVIMSTIASQITGLSIVYSTVYLGANKENVKAPRHWPLWG